MTKSQQSVATQINRRRSESGTGLIGALLGACAFLAFMALAANTLVGLYATSVVTSVAQDAARRVATASDTDDPSEAAAAEVSARKRLASLHDVQMTWKTNDNGDVGLDVSADKPTLLPRSLVSTSRSNTIERTVWIRREQLQ